MPRTIYKSLFYIYILFVLASCQNGQDKTGYINNKKNAVSNIKYFAWQEMFPDTIEEIGYLKTSDYDNSILELKKIKNKFKKHIRVLNFSYSGHDSTFTRLFFTCFNDIDTIYFQVDNGFIKIPNDMFGALNNAKCFNYVGGLNDFDSIYYKGAKNLNEFHYTLLLAVPETLYPNDSNYQQMESQREIRNTYVHFQKLVICLSKVPNLEKVHLNRFELPSLPSEIFNLNKLEYLNLDTNDIRSLNCNLLSQMKSLKTLSLIGNQIKPTPKCLVDIGQLKIIM